MSTICYSASEIYAFRLSAPKPTRTTRKNIFRLSLWNPDHPPPIPVLSSSRNQNSNMSYHQPNKVLRSRQLREITPTSTNYLSPGFTSVPGMLDQYPTNQLQYKITSSRKD